MYGRLVHKELEVADDRHYDRVVDLLGRWRPTLGLHGRAKELELQVAAIRDLHARGTRLLARMDKAGLSMKSARRFPPRRQVFHVPLTGLDLGFVTSELDAPSETHPLIKCVKMCISPI